MAAKSVVCDLEIARPWGGRCAAACGLDSAPGLVPRPLQAINAPSVARPARRCKAAPAPTPARPANTGPREQGRAARSRPPVPACRKITASPMRRACPRSCVTITMVTPRPCAAFTRSSIICVEAGSRLLVGSSRNSRSGAHAKRAGHRQPLLLAPRQSRAGCRALSVSRAISSASATLALARPPAPAMHPQRKAQVAQHRAAQHHRALKHHRLRAACGPRAVPCQPCPPRRQKPVQHPEQHALARAVRAHHQRAPPRFDAQVDPVQDRLPARRIAQAPRRQQRRATARLRRDIGDQITHRPPSPPRRAASSRPH